MYIEHRYKETDMPFDFYFHLSRWLQKDHNRLCVQFLTFPKLKIFVSLFCYYSIRALTPLWDKVGWFRFPTTKDVNKLNIFRLWFFIDRSNSNRAYLIFIITFKKIWLKIGLEISQNELNLCYENTTFCCILSKRSSIQFTWLKSISYFLHLFNLP